MNIGIFMINFNRKWMKYEKCFNIEYVNNDMF